METLMYAVLPLLVTGITSGIKRIPIIPEDGGWRYVIIRFIAAILSFGGVIGTYMITGSPVDPTSVQTFVLAFMTFIGSVGGHELLKQK